MPEGSGPSQFGGGAGGQGGGFSMGGFSGGGASGSSASSGNLIQYGAGLAVIAAALAFALLYRRRPHRR